MKKSVLKYTNNFKKIVLKYPNNHCLFSTKVLNKMLLVLTGRPASGIKIGGVVPSGLGIIIRVGGFLVQTPLCAWLGLGTQPRSEAPTGLGVEITKPQ